jgi:hypothetical protein
VGVYAAGGGAVVGVAVLAVPAVGRVGTILSYQ